GWSSGALAVSRIITVQAERFPELERLAHEEGWVAAVKGVARVLAHYVERNEISVGDPELAADMFLNLVLGRAHSGGPLRYPRTRKAMEQRVQAAVRLFLEGGIVSRTKASPQAKRKRIVHHKRLIRSVQVGSIAPTQTSHRLRPMPALSQKRTCAIRSR